MTMLDEKVARDLFMVIVTRRGDHDETSVRDILVTLRRTYAAGLREGVEIARRGPSPYAHEVARLLEERAKEVERDA